MPPLKKHDLALEEHDLALEEHDLALEEHDLAQRIEHAKTRRWHAGAGNNDEPTDYSLAANVFAYCAEQLTQSSVLLLNELRDDTRRKVIRNLSFTTGIVGRTAELEGGIGASVYHGYDTEEGNQIDIFLKEIGYLKK